MAVPRGAIPLGSGFEIADKAPPTARRRFVRRRGDEQDPRFARAANRVAVLYSARQEHESTVFELELCAAAAEAERTLHQVEDLVFGFVSVVAGFFAGTSGVFDNREAPSPGEFACLHNEVRAEVVGPAF